MISLTIGRNAFKICHKEGSRTTVWDVRAEDGEEKLIQTFKDVIAFVEGEQAALPPGAPAYAVRPESTRKDRHPLPSNGWAAYAPPPVPPHLEGEVELVRPGEGA